MEYKNDLSNKSATTENHSSNLDLTLRMGLPNDIVDQQDESRVQADNGNREQHRQINAGQYNYMNEGHMSYVNPGHLNYVNQGPWMNFSSRIPPTSNMLTTTNVVPLPRNIFTSARLMPPTSNRFPTTTVTPHNPTRPFVRFPPPISRRRMETPERTCSVCRTKTTPMWRKGPNGPQTLCNACGLRHARILKREN